MALDLGLLLMDVPLACHNIVFSPITMYHYSVFPEWKSFCNPGNFQRFLRSENSTPHRAGCVFFLHSGVRPRLEHFGELFVVPLPPRLLPLRPWPPATPPLPSTPHAPHPLQLSCGDGPLCKILFTTFPPFSLLPSVLSEL